MLSLNCLEISEEYDMSKSGITWTEKTWSPVTGCTKVSAGCKNCFAEREVEGRWSKNPKSVFFGRSFTDVQCHENQLAVPMKWKNPHRIFVCPRADLFHESVPFEFIAAVFGVMSIANQHTFLVLTKRPERMLNFFEWLQHEANRVPGSTGPASLCSLKLLLLGVDLPRHVYSEKVLWPLLNVQIGVTVENQESADDRIPLLIKTPAAVRWISAEPLIGQIDLLATSAGDILCRCDGCMSLTPDTRLDWVVVGGESGPHARPMHPDWVRTLRDECAATGVPFLFKQWGEFIVPEDGEQACRVCGCTWNNACHGGCSWVEPDLCSECVGKSAVQGERSVKYRRVGIKAAGRLLDGVLHDAYPKSRSEN